jgi:murein DD-endopeptidase MepM/ murein hydrolase activator NlpD
VKRAIARWQTQWLELFVVAVLLDAFVLDVPWIVGFAVLLGVLALAFVRPPRSTRPPVPVAAPVRGRWVALNSPGTMVPSHGIRAYGQAYAIDILQPGERHVGWGLRTRAPQTYACFGQDVHAVADGTVVAVDDTMRDHRARDTWWALVYMMTVEAGARELLGARRILGNHVVIEHDPATFSVYAHLRRGSALVRPGDRVVAGEPLAAVGNSGNTSEPHLHFQLMDRARPTAAAGIPFLWEGLTMSPDDVDPTWTTRGVRRPVEGVPPNGQVFTAHEPSHRA